MAIGQNQKLIGQLSLGLTTLKTDIQEANKILASINVKKLNLDIIDSTTKTKLLETTKLIKKEIEGMAIGVDSSKLKSSIDSMLKSFNSIQIKAKEMTPVITQTFNDIGTKALESAKNQEIASNKMSTSYDKSGKKVVENLKAIFDAQGKLEGYNPTSKVTTDDASAKLTKISTAYKNLSADQKANVNVMNGMETEVNKVIEKYGLQGKALDSATTQGTKYRTEADKITAAQIKQTEATDKAFASSNKKVQAEVTKQGNASAAINNKDLETQYKDNLSLAEAMGRVHTQSNINIQDRAKALSGQQTATLQQEAKEEALIGDAIAKTTRARETERLAQGKTDAAINNKNLESEYAARVKLAASTEKQSLAELKLYTQEKSQTSQYNQMSKQLAQISGEANLAMSSSNAGSSMTDRFKVSGVYAAAAAGIYALRSAVKDMIQTNIDFEVGLNELSRILNVTGQQLADFGKNQIQIAKDMGEPLAQVQSAYSSLAAAGVQNTAELNSMARTVTMALNTSTIKDAATASDLLTTSMKQMNIPFSESEKVLDQWNYLADKSVATTEDFAQATSKAGLTSLSMGVDISHLNAMVATLADSTGASGTQIGDALKSVESRLLRPETLAVLEKYGINVMKDATHFKDFGAIITDVSTQLDKFGDNTIQSTEILDTLGGNIIIYLKDYIVINIIF